MSINIFSNKNSIKPFIIAEIGHNHKGSVEIAKKLFLSAKNCGADAVKLQKRDNKNLFIKNFYNQIYDNKNSYGKTYGHHREKLEFGYKEYKELLKYSKKIKIKFICTPFDFNSLNFLEKFDLDGYKIASADLKNPLLQEKIAKSNKPIFLSTGGGTLLDIKKAAKNILKFNKKLSILHCTSSYPCDIENMNLNIITLLKKEFPKLAIGLSDHENGIDAASVAYMLGARVFEKHFTLDRSWKGTDHSFSLEPDGLRKLVRNLHRIPLILGSKVKKLLNIEKKPLYKMSKSIVSAKNLKKGHKIKLDDLAFKSPGDGLSPDNYKFFINKKLSKNLNKDDIIKKKYVN